MIFFMYLDNEIDVNSHYEDFKSVVIEEQKLHL